MKICLGGLMQVNTTREEILEYPFLILIHGTIFPKVQDNGDHNAGGYEIPPRCVVHQETNVGFH